MSRQKTQPRAQNAVAAALDRAIERGASRMVLVYVDPDGQRFTACTTDMDLLATAGLLSLALGDLSAGGMTEGDEP